MADFGKLTGQKILRSAMKTARFASKVKSLMTSATAPFVEAASGQASNILRSVKRFFDSTPGQTETYNKVSTAKLEQQDATAQIKLKQRAIAEVQAQTREQLAQVLDAYSRGRISIEAFGEQARGIIRKQSLAAAIIGVGGIGNLTENILTATARQITEQFSLLDGFIDDLATKGRDTDAKDRARIRQYANSAFSVAANANRQFQIDRVGASELEECRRLGAAEHCEDCLSLADSWEPAGYLPAIGQGTVCGNNCHCWIQVRTRSDNDAQNADVTGVSV